MNTQSSLRHGKIGLFIKQENFGISRFINVLNSESKFTQTDKLIQVAFQNISTQLTQILFKIGHLTVN